ncbi:MAG: glycosyltransferase family 39 protein [Phycisphaerae bacterium]|nr:glycosyltransferase family 39 protein [Phycisphaerae bacterium]
MPLGDGTRPISKGLLVLYGLAGLAILLVPWLPVRLLMNHVLYEDFFYYLQIAKNIVESGQPTFDGAAPTNGFAPMWMAVCAIAQLVADGDAAVHLLLTLAALLHLAQAYLVYRILAATCRRLTAHLAAVFYLLNYRILACNLCGLETPLVVFLFLAAIYLIVRSRPPAGLARCVLLGLVLGAAVLTRFDQILLVVFVLVVVLANRAFGQRLLQNRMPAAALVAAVVLLMLTPWFMWSYRHSGTLLPRNDEALKLSRFQQFDLSQPLLHNLHILELKAKETAWWLSDTANLLGLWPAAGPAGGLAMAAVGSILLLAIAVGLCAVRSAPGHRLRCALAACALSIFLFYFVFACTEVRYLIACCGLLIVVAAMIVNEFLERRHSRWMQGAAAVSYAIILLVALSAGVSAWKKNQGATRTHGLHASLYQTAQWLRDHTEPNAIIGSWNAGILGRYSNRTVVNLDGVVNNEAVDAIRHRALAEYVQDRRIDYLVDMHWEVDRYMRRFGGNPAWQDDYRLVHQVHGCTVVLQKRSATPGPGRNMDQAISKADQTEPKKAGWNVALPLAR